MKKVAILCLTLVMVMTLSLNVFATGAFVSSPSGNSAPILDSFVIEEEGCTVDIVIVPHSSRDQLPEEQRDEMDAAYAEVVANAAGSSLVNALNALSSQSNVALSSLAVSDLFAVMSANCTTHADHGTTPITLTTETIEHFVGLLVYENGAWGLVDAADYSIAGNKLTLKSMDATYAIVLDTTYMESSPVTAPEEAGQISPVWYMLMAVAVIGMAVVAILYSRVRANENE